MITNYYNRFNLTLLLAVFVILSAWLLIDRCDGAFKKPPKTYSVDTTALHQQLEAYKKEKTVTAELLKQENRAKDSALDLARRYGQLLSEEKRTAARLATRLDLAKRDNDTASYINTCDSLQLVVRQEKDHSALMQLNYESTISILNGIVREKDTAISRQEQLIDTLRIKYKESVALVVSANRDLQRAQKKNDRKYSIGPSVSYGIGPDGRLVPVIGISFQRTLIKIKL